MSKWTDIRDSALEAMKEGALNVVEETKQTFLTNFIEAGVPVIEEYAARFSAAVKAQAANESGWTKIRDLFVIPLAVKLCLYVGKQILQMVQSQTGKAAETPTV